MASETSIGPTLPCERHHNSYGIEVCPGCLDELLAAVRTVLFQNVDILAGNGIVNVGLRTLETCIKPFDEEALFNAVQDRRKP